MPCYHHLIIRRMFCLVCYLCILGEFRCILFPVNVSSVGVTVHGVFGDWLYEYFWVRTTRGDDVGTGTCTVGDLCYWCSLVMWSGVECRNMTETPTSPQNICVCVNIYIYIYICVCVCVCVCGCMTSEDYCIQGDRATTFKRLEGTWWEKLDRCWRN